ncbi:MAG TPA: DUF721 domain-containing protein [Verrucomicrobiae bacterium]|nr:DUF721 domain-containing protein [Verrucomicrobiae bacterium]
MKARKSLPTEADYRQLCGVGPDAQWATGDAKPPKVVLGRLLEKLKLEERFRQAEIQALWPRLVGEFNARHSHPDSLRRGVLLVRVTHAPLRHHLEMMRSELIRHFEEQLQSTTIREIRFVA